MKGEKWVPRVKIILKLGFFATLLVITNALGDNEVKTKNKRLLSRLSRKVIKEDRRLRTGEDIDQMTGRNYLLDLSEGSVIRGVSSEYKQSNKPFRKFQSMIWNPFSSMETSDRKYVTGSKANQDFEKQCDDGMFVTEINAVYYPIYKEQLFKFGCSSFLHVLRVDCEWSNYVNDINSREDFTFECDENKIISGVKSEISKNADDRSFSFYCCGYYYGEWEKDEVEKFTKTLSGRADETRKHIINFFYDLKKITSNCDRFQSNFGMNICEMEGGFRKRNRLGFEETLGHLTEWSESRTKVDTFDERTLDDNSIKDKEIQVCEIDHVIKPQTKKTNFLKEVTVLLADPNYDEEDFRNSTEALNAFKYCTEGMLHFFPEIHKIDIDVSDMHWENATFEVMQKAKQDLDIEFIRNGQLSDQKNLMIDFNLDKHMTMIVLPDNVNFGDKYGFALMHSGFSVIKASATEDGRSITHEIGHNLGMMHSATKQDQYGDDRCIMGQARSKNTCFNGAKSDYLGLYRQDTAIVYAQNYNCKATLLLADLQEYLFSKRDIYKTHGTFYVIVKVPDALFDTYFMYYSDDRTISVVIGGIGEIHDTNADTLFYAKESTRLFELKQGQQEEYNGVFYKHCAHIDTERVATLLIRTYSNAPCPSITSERFNLALGRPSYQSSTYAHTSAGKWNGDASIGNDGDFFSGDNACTHKYPDAYWEVTLAADRSIIDEVIIYNRIDAPQHYEKVKNRIRGGKVEILDSNKKVIATRTIEEAFDIIKIDFEDGIEGAAVRIWAPPGNYLHFRECVVNGREYLGSSPSAVPPLFTNVTANEFLHLPHARLLYQPKVGESVKTYMIGYIESNESLFSRLCNFGPKGTTKSIQISYGRGISDGGKVEIRLDEPKGQLIGTIYPKTTGHYQNFVTFSIPVEEGVHGVHSVIFVASYGAFYLEWFKLSAEGLSLKN